MQKARRGDNLRVIGGCISGIVIVFRDIIYQDVTLYTTNKGTTYFYIPFGLWPDLNMRSRSASLATYMSYSYLNM